MPGFKSHGPFKEQSDGQYLGDLTLLYLNSRSALKRGSRRGYFSVSLNLISWVFGSTNLYFL